MSRLLGLYILNACILLGLASCEKKDPTSFEIKGTLENTVGGYFYASREKGDTVRIDTVAIDSDGRFLLEGKVDTLTIMKLYFNKNTKSTYLLVDKGWQMTIDGDVFYPDLLKIKGGDINDDLAAFRNENKELLKRRADILNSAENKLIANDSIVDKDYVVELKNINFELSNIATEYTRANPTKIASVILINTFFKDENSTPRLEENLALLRGKAASFQMTADLKRYLNKVKVSQVGAVAPNFTLKNLKGKNVSLSDYRGKYVLLSFVSTTCDMCIASRKYMIEEYNELKKQKRNIEFLTIVMDTEIEPVGKDITDSVKWSILPEEGSWAAPTFDLYYIRELPYNILVSPTGTVLERNFPINVLSDKIDALIKQEEKD